MLWVIFLDEVTILFLTETRDLSWNLLHQLDDNTAFFGLVNVKEMCVNDPQIINLIMWDNPDMVLYCGQQYKS